MTNFEKLKRDLTLEQAKDILEGNCRFCIAKDNDPETPFCDGNCNKYVAEWLNSNADCDAKET